MSTDCTVRFVDEHNNFAQLPSALPNLVYSETDPDSANWHTAAQKRAMQDAAGLLAVLRTVRNLLRHNSAGFAAAAATAAATFDNEQYAESDTNYAQTILTQLVPATPTFVSVTPAHAAHGTPTAVTIAGTGFRAGATVTFGGIAATSVVVVSATSITCTTPVLTAGAKNIVIANPSGSSVTATSAWTAD